MLETKTSVSFVELHPAIRWALDVASALWQKHGVDRVVVTSLSDSTHSATSFHYGRPGDARARAVDLRIWNVPSKLREPLAAELRHFLGPCYEVLVEKDHYHVELDCDDLPGLG